MSSVNKLILIGNVGSEPEMRFTPSGRPVTSFSLATNKKYSTSDGERKEETNWFKITTWGKLAETCNEFVSKGMSIYAEGAVRLDEWEGEDGQKRSRMVLTANQIQFLTPRKQNGEVPQETEGELEDVPF